MIAVAAPPLGARSDVPRGEASVGVVELFAGLGSVGRSFQRSAVIAPILLSDVDGVARDTCLENWPGVRYVLRDARHLRRSDVLDAPDGRTVVGLLGCPPCQGFSAAGQRIPPTSATTCSSSTSRLLLATSA